MPRHQGPFLTPTGIFALVIAAMLLAVVAGVALGVGAHALFPLVR